MTQPNPEVAAAAVSPGAGASHYDKDQPSEETSFLGYLRDWADALVIAFVVAMFIRMFVVELFKIPSGSMSPTLLGDWVAQGTAADSDGDSHEYLLILDPSSELVQVFQKKENGAWDYQGREPSFALSASQKVLLQSKIHREEHRILVNKFAYWFKKPDRGDIVIFRVPFKQDPKPYSRNGVTIPGHPYNRNESVYVKRAVAFAGEEVSIRPDQHLYINGKAVTDPVIISRLQYVRPNGNDYDITVPKEHLVVLGDNSDNSLDSRYWGPLPLNNLRGKAVLRYWPFKDKWFLSPR